MINELRDLIKSEIQKIYEINLINMELLLPCKLKISKTNKLTYNDIVFKYPSIKKVKDKITVLFSVEIESDLNNILQKIVYNYLESKGITTIKGNIILDLYVIDKKEYLEACKIARFTIKRLVEMENKMISDEALDNVMVNLSDTIITYMHTKVFRDKSEQYLNIVFIGRIYKEISIYDIDQYEEFLFSIMKKLDESDFSEILSNYVEIYNYKAKFKEVNKLSLFLSLVENIIFTKSKFNRYQDLFTVEDVSNNLLISNIKRGVENCD